MQVQRLIKATLSNEDVKAAIAEYASKNLPEGQAFNPDDVFIAHENERDEIEVEAVVTIKAN